MLRQLRHPVPLCLLILLLLSMAGNAWLWWQVKQAPHATSQTIKKVFHPVSPPPPLPIRPARTEPSSPAATERPSDESDSASVATAAPSAPPEKLPTADLLFGAAWSKPIMPRDQASRPPVSMQRLQELAQARPEEVETYEVHGRLRLPGERWIEFGPLTVAPSQTLRWSMIKEFPYPEAFQFAHYQHPAQGSSFAVSPTTPTSFTTQQLGIELELDVEPVGGFLIIGGKLNHRTATSFDVMTGEAFAPITATAVGLDGQSTELIFSDNQVLQPRFAISESPFVVSASAGTPVQIPVRTAFGATFLEITCHQVP